MINTGEKQEPGVAGPEPAPNAPVRCVLCPRRCGADRRFRQGACGGGSLPRVARAAPHHWEEPCISGSRGSGTVFFTGCPLGCVFCQNHAISHRGGAGRRVTAEELAGIFLDLQRQGVHNLNLVTATHYLPWVQMALGLARGRGLALPVVWNSSGYETAATMAALAGMVDVSLLDLKYKTPALGQRLAAAPD
jgi:putative pyruvate formate lyase activating enzyme